MKLYYAFISTVFLVFAYTFADWERTYNPVHLGFNMGWFATEATDNDFILFGFNWSSIGFWFARLNEFGDIETVRTYSTDTIHLWILGPSVTKCNGGLALTGYNRRAEDLFVMKLSYWGDSLWLKIYVSEDNFSLGSSICQTLDNGYVIAGTFGRDYINTSHILVMKTDSVGDSIWARCFGNIEIRPRGLCIIQTHDGGFAVGGEWNGAGCLLRLDSDGDSLWLKTYFEPYLFRDVVTVIETDDNGFMLLGDAGPNIGVIRTDSLGNVLWNRIYGSEYMDIAGWLTKTSDGGYIIAGMSDQAERLGSSNGYLAKIDGNGDTLWVRKFNPAGRQNRLWHVVETSDGGCIATGEACLPLPDTSCAYLIKLDPMGVIEWERTMPITLPFSVSPSPFNSSCIISAPAGSDVEIYDVNGRLVWSSSIYGASGNYSQRGDLSPRKIVWTPDESVKSGIYFVRAVIGGQTMVKRVVLVR